MPKSWRLALIIVPVLVLLGVVAVQLLAGAGVPGADAPVPEVALSDAELRERGEYLTIAGNCASCHTAPGGAFMAGGRPFHTPFGVIHSTNITPDTDTGIGGWSARAFLNSMRHGVRPDGEHLYPVFPYTAYTRVSDEDALAIFAYLRSVPPVATEPVPNELGFPFDQRALMAFWKLMFFDAGAFEPDAERSETWNRGAYLVEALAHCSACHTPRNALGAEQSAMAFAGGEYLGRAPGAGLVPWSAPNLTPATRGLGAWTIDDLVAYLKHGRNAFLESFGPMNEVVVNSTRFLSTDDLEAMAVYLDGLAVIDEPTASEPDQQTLGRGRTIYNLHCGTCHLPTGEGDPEMAPRLNRGSLLVQDANPASMLNAILHGPQTPDRSLIPPSGPQWRHPMDAFRYELDDDEVAALASFIRHSWDNAAGPVTAEQVARQRP